MDGFVRGEMCEGVQAGLAYDFSGSTMSDVGEAYVE